MMVAKFAARATTGGDIQSAIQQNERQAKPLALANIAIALPHHLPSGGGSRVPPPLFLSKNGGGIGPYRGPV